MLCRYLYRSNIQLDFTSVRMCWKPRMFWLMRSSKSSSQYEMHVAYSFLKWEINPNNFYITQCFNQWDHKMAIETKFYVIQWFSADAVFFCECHRSPKRTICVLTPDRFWNALRDFLSFTFSIVFSLNAMQNSIKPIRAF